MSITHKPFTQIAIFDGSGAELQTGTIRNSMPPDIAAPGKFFFGGGGSRTPVRATTAFSVDLADTDDMNTLLDQFTISGQRSSESVNIVAFGAGRCLQWYEDTPIEVRQGDLAYDTMRLDFFSGKLAPSIYHNTSLLAYKGWSIDTAATPDVVDGWAAAVVGTGSSTFDDSSISAGVLTISLDAVTAPTNTDVAAYYADIPIGANTGPVITFTVTFNAIPSNQDSLKIYIEERDIGGSAVGVASETSVSSTGTKTVQHTIAQGDCYSLRVGLTWTYSNGDYANEITTITQPTATYTL